MAKIYPSLDEIKNFKPAPTTGEWKLLHFFNDNYDDSYEVFFQPFLNEARPDIVVMRRGCGVMIFEVKDWNLSNYYSTPTGTWVVKANGEEMNYTPIRQVLSYKEKLYSLNSIELLKRQISNNQKVRTSSWGLVSCAVFFHKSTDAEVKALCFPSDITDEYEKKLKYISLLGDDALTTTRVNNIFYRTYLSRRNPRFSDEVYEDLFRLFKPDFHTIEQGKRFTLSSVQQALSESVAGARKRIKGVAGSGKSFVLARRAVNAHKRTNGNVLILTYNITLKNYLHDRISEVRDSFSWSFFHIENYHQHFNRMLDQCNMTIKDVARKKWPSKVYQKDTQLNEAELDEIYSDVSTFRQYKDIIEKYDVILIDEAQDYQEEWIRILMNYSASPGAEIVAFADEKQNVYNRELGSDKFPVIPITSGPWDTKLNASYRLNTGIADLAHLFQRHFFAEKYAIDEKIISNSQLELLFKKTHVEYHYRAMGMMNNAFTNLAKYIQSVIRKYKLHLNDLTVLSSSVDCVRELSHAYARLTGESVNCMCETSEEKKKIENDLESLKKLRRFKKVHFWQNTGAVSFSSIHSFKGLETPALLLIIGNNTQLNEKEDDESSLVKFAMPCQELVYVGITRTRNFLFVINFNDKEIDGFFKEEQLNKLPSMEFRTSSK